MFSSGVWMVVTQPSIGIPLSRGFPIFGAAELEFGVTNMEAERSIALIEQSLCCLRYGSRKALK